MTTTAGSPQIVPRLPAAAPALWHATCPDCCSPQQRCDKVQRRRAPSPAAHSDNL